MCKRLTSLVLLSLVAACGEDPLFTPGECRGAPWRQSFPIPDLLWSDQGAVSADNGEHVFVVWQQRIENGDIGDTLMAVVLDSSTGAIVHEPREIAFSAASVWSIDVVATAEGFVLVSGNPDRGMVVRTFDREGVEQKNAIVPIDDWALDNPVVADGDGISLLTWGVRIDRIDSAAAVVSTASPLSFTTFCSDATAISAGRVAAWCYDFSTGETGDAFLLTMNSDGSDAVVLPQDDGFQGEHGRVAFAGGVIFVAFELGADVFVGALDEAGAVVAAPVRIGGSGEKESLLGSEFCTDTCKGLNLAAVGDGVLLGFEVIADDQSWERRIEVRNIGLDGKGIVTNGRHARRSAHAHDIAQTPNGPLVTWIDTTGFHFPWEWPPQAVQVERSCNTEAP